MGFIKEAGLWLKLDSAEESRRNKGDLSMRITELQRSLDQMAEQNARLASENESLNVEIKKLVPSPSCCCPFTWP